jgi:hypothetical protein
MNAGLIFILLAKQDANAPRPGDWSFGWDSVAIIAGVALAIIFVAWIVARILAARERKNKNSPWCLLKDLAEAQGLNHRERQLLTRLAQHLQLPEPAALFVEQSYWEADRLGGSWASARPELDKLRKRLFAVR